MTQHSVTAQTETRANQGVRLALQRKDAAAALGISVDTFDRHVRGEVRCVYVGDTRLWPVAELERWLAEHAMMPATTRSAPATAGTAPGHDQEVES